MLDNRIHAQCERDGDFHLQLASPHPSLSTRTCWTLSNVSLHNPREDTYFKKQGDARVQPKEWGHARQRREYFLGEEGRWGEIRPNIRQTRKKMLKSHSSSSGEMTGKWSAGNGGEGEPGQNGKEREWEGFRPHVPQLCKLKVSAASPIPPKKGDIYRTLAVAANGPLLCHPH